MSPEEYDSLTNASPFPIKVADLSDQTLRLLISTVKSPGSTVDTTILLAEDKKFLISYSGESHLSDFIYPDITELHEVDWRKSDYEFCRLLIHRGARLYFYEGYDE